MVIMNRRAGTGRRRFQPAEVAEVFRRYGIEPDIREVEGEHIAATVAEASGVDVVVSAGGDGTLLTVAEGLIRGGPPGGRKPLGILPAGTINHLARNAGIPLDLDGAARAIAGGRVMEIDAAEVNGRLFLTDAMIGLLTWVLFAAERRRENLLVRGWVLLSMLVRVLLRLPLVAMKVRGRLCLYLPKTARRLTLLRRRRLIMAMIDGEFEPLRSPLRVRILPRALRLFVPAVEDGGIAAAGS